MSGEPAGTSAAHSTANDAALRDDARAPVALDDATSSAISALIAEQLAAALAKFQPHDTAAAGQPAAPPAAGTDTPVAGHGAPASSGGADAVEVDDEDYEEETDGAGAEPAASQPAPARLAGVREQGEEDGDPDDDDDPDDEEDPAGREDAGDGHQAFSEAWYEARRNYLIPLRFEVPRRFEDSFPVGFTPESVEHFRTFSTSTTSRGRAEEASSLYVTAAYLTEASNSLSGLVHTFLDFLPRLRTASDREELRKLVLRLSDAQVTTFGVYELAASRYEVLCGLQGVAGVADPALLAAYIDPPAAFSSAGRQAFRRQQTQAIRYAAQAAGRRRGPNAPRALPSPAPAPVSSGGTGRAAGSSKRGGRVTRGQDRGRDRGRGQ